MEQIYENEDFILFDNTHYGSFGTRILTPEYMFCVKDKNGTEISKMHIENGQLIYTRFKSLMDSGIYEKKTFKELFEKVKDFISKDKFDTSCWCFLQD